MILKRGPREQGRLLKRAVTPIAKQEVRLLVVRHEDIGIAVAIVVGRCRAHSLPYAPGDSRRLAHVPERAIAAIAK